MKRLIILALVLATGATLHIDAAKKKKAEAAPQPRQERLVPATAADSLSYAAGRAASMGLAAYLRQEYQVDTAYMKQVIEGFSDAVTRADDPAYRAYNAGTQVARMVLTRILPGMASQFKDTPDSITRPLFMSGFSAALLGDTTVFGESEAAEYFETRLKADREAAEKAWRGENEQWLGENGRKEGVQTTASGLQYRVVTAGTGAVPTAKDRVTVKYEGRMIDGKVFDSSYTRDPQTSTFGCSEVIKGWTEALTMMPVGSKWELYIPQALGYGGRAAGSIRPYSTLIFTVELVGIEQQKEEEKAE